MNSSPQVLLEGGDSDEAEKVFNSLKVLDGVSDLNSAMILAKNKLAKISEGGKIVVLSDFLETESASFLEKELFFDEKTPIKIIQLKHLAKNNIGVIDLKLDERKGKAFIKNFCCGDKTLGIEYEGQAETLSIPLGGVEEYEFDVPYGTSVLKLRNEDGLNEDNLLYVSKPSETNLKVSLISFNPSKHLVAALSSPNDISLKISSPLDPNVGDHDIYVLQNIGQISKSLRKELGKELEFGKGLIIHVEEGINGNYDSLLDFEIEGNVGGGNSKINYNGPLLEGLEFGKQQKVRNIVCENECGGGLVSINDIPLLMLQSSREGVVGYYGIDEKNGFKNTPNYPLFWNRFLRHVSGVEDIHGTNILTGTVKFVGKDTTYTLPTGAKIKGDQIVFDEVGFYEVDGKTYASNLLNIEESSIHEPVKDYESRGDWEIKSGEIERKSVWKEIILLIILLLIVEWLACNKKVKRCRYYA